MTTMTEPAVDVAEREVQQDQPDEQTPEVAAAAVETPEQIPADDPRARPMWATIARTAMQEGASEYYEQIAKSLGAPTIESLKESKDLNGTKTVRFRIMFQTERSIADNDGEPDPMEVREYLKAILRKKDKGFMEAIDRREVTTDYLADPPEQTRISAR